MTPGHPLNVVRDRPAPGFHPGQEGMRVLATGKGEVLGDPHGGAPSR